MNRWHRVSLGGMHTRRLRAASLASLAVGLVALAPGCGDDDGGTSSSSGGGQGGEGGAATSTSTSGATTTTSGASGGGQGGQGGEGGGAPIVCQPSELGASSLDTSCGVFVDGVNGDDAGDGSRSAPFATLGAAAALLGNGGGSIYLCGEGEYAGNVTLVGGTSVYGGLACGTWTYDAGLVPSIVGAADLPALRIDGTGVGALEDIEVRAVDAVAPGGSSIALIVRTAAVDVRRARIIAGRAAAGAEGESAPATHEGVGANGLPGMDLATGCTIVGQPGGASVSNTCSIGGNSSSGAGGFGAATRNDGADGMPTSLGGAGGTGSCQVGVSTSGFGGAGLPGPAGVPGAAATGWGSLGFEGFAPAAGGTAGTPGTTGGGGGGGASGTSTTCSLGITNGVIAAASGGSGGAGGCGGLEGQGGESGGSSFALVTIDAVVTLASTSLVSDNGGVGGDGGTGQPGAAGGTAGPGGSSGNPIGAANGCRGGVGGAGGHGGGGGGGRGGHTAAIAVKGTAPTQISGVTLSIGAAGLGGVGAGNGTLPGSDGANGQACGVLGFDDSGGLSCAPP